MTLSNLDRELLQSCLTGKHEAWAELTDRFLGLIVHVVNHTAEARNIQITPESRDDLVAEVFLSWIEKDFDVLRRFHGNSSLATYLTVIARRVVTRRLSQLRVPQQVYSPNPNSQEPTSADDRARALPPKTLEENSQVETLPEKNLLKEDIERLMGQLSPDEAIAVRMFHVEGRSYDEISKRLGIPTDSVGPFLSNAREKLRAIS